MGLESFKTSSTRGTAKSGNDEKKSSNQQSSSVDQEAKKEESNDQPYKVVGGDRGLKKVFPTEEDWNETVDFIEDTMSVSVNEVMNMPADKRHQILHRAILKREDGQQEPFHPKRNCMVCGEDFVFPGSWNFTRFNGEPVCHHHSIEEVVQKYREINTLHG